MGYLYPTRTICSCPHPSIFVHEEFIIVLTPSQISACKFWGDTMKITL